MSEIFHTNRATCQMAHWALKNYSLPEDVGNIIPVNNHKAKNQEKELQIQ